MKRYDLLTPEGTRDLLFDECVALRAADAKLRGIFLSRGYTEAVTPGLEFYDVSSLSIVEPLSPDWLRKSSILI